MEIASSSVAQTFLSGVSYESHSYFQEEFWITHLTVECMLQPATIGAGSTFVLAVVRLRPLAFLQFLSGERDISASLRYDDSVLSEFWFFRVQ